jgi:hypothetical protein
MTRGATSPNAQVAALCRRYGGDGIARAIEQCARELEATDAAGQDAVLTLTEAARESGHSVEHIGRLVRQGVIPNSGRKGAPRVRRGDLPRRARRVAFESDNGYDLAADARALVSRRRSRHGD